MCACVCVCVCVVVVVVVVCVGGCVCVCVCVSLCVPECESVCKFGFTCVRVSVYGKSGMWLRECLCVCACVCVCVCVCALLFASLGNFGFGMQARRPLQQGCMLLLRLRAVVAAGCVCCRSLLGVTCLFLFWNVVVMLYMRQHEGGEDRLAPNTHNYADD